MIGNGFQLLKIKEELKERERERAPWRILDESGLYREEWVGLALGLLRGKKNSQE